MSIRPIAAAALAAALAACTGSPIGEDREERRIGILRLYRTDPPVALAAPDTVRAGVDFQVTATTLGGGCERAGETEAQVGGGVAVVTPYDYTELGVDCPDILRHLHHAATLRFPAPGKAVVRVQGRRVGPDTPGEGVAHTVEKRIVVR
ncbi:MAG TPA: hypothetical protein VF615_20825 [Longimicrobiaceae bacterium]|jgi:hypothetical protein